MEPTGIEPGDLLLAKRHGGCPTTPGFSGIAGETALLAAHGYGWIRRD
jgi:hypothetical protein